MIYLFFGNDRESVLVKSNEATLRFLKDFPEALFVRMGEEDFEKAKLEEFIGGRSLFSKKIVILCDGLFNNKEAGVFVIKKILEIGFSSNIFIFRESSLDKKTIEAFKSADAKTEESNKDGVAKQGYAGAREVGLKTGYENFNVFNFTDAIGSGDKKATWVLYQKALRAGFSAEELFWKAVWIFRHIALASPLNSDPKGVVARLKTSPFVFNKAKGFNKNYKPDQITHKYKQLVDIYHEARRGMVDMEMAMEKFILNL